MIEERISEKHGIRFQVRVEHNRKKHVIGTYRTRREALAAEAKARTEIRKGTFAPPSEVRKQEPKPEPKITTVADAMSIWLDTKRNTLQPNSVYLYESAMRLHIVPALGDLDITTLTHDDIQVQVNQWRDGGMGARLIGRCVVNLKAALQRYVRSGVLTHNPAEGVEKPSARSKKPLPAWTDEQIDAFLTKALAAERYAPFWALTLLEGMRRGEALGLRWRDLHWGDDETTCTAVITQTVVADQNRAGAALVQNRAKTKASQRAVKLTSPTIAALKAHRDRQRFERQRLADLWGDHDLIVTTGIGTPVTPSSIKRNLAHLIVAAGVPKITTHGLRHQAATIMLRAGVSPALVALKLGHGDISTTVNLYGHLVVSDQAAANEAIEAAVKRGRSA